MHYSIVDEHGVAEVHIGWEALGRVFVFSSEANATYEAWRADLRALPEGFHIAAENGQRLTFEDFFTKVVEPSRNLVSARTAARRARRTSGKLFTQAAEVAFDYLDGKRYENDGYDFKDGEFWDHG